MKTSSPIHESSMRAHTRTHAHTHVRTRTRTHTHFVSLFHTLPTNPPMLCGVKLATDPGHFSTSVGGVKQLALLFVTKAHTDSRLKKSIRNLNPALSHTPTPPRPSLGHGKPPNILLNVRVSPSSASHSANDSINSAL